MAFSLSVTLAGLLIGVENLRRHIKQGNQRYVDYMRARGFSPEAVGNVGIDVVQKASELAPAILKRFPNGIFYALLICHINCPSGRTTELAATQHSGGCRGQFGTPTASLIPAQGNALGKAAQNPS